MINLANAKNITDVISDVKWLRDDDFALGEWIFPSTSNWTVPAGRQFPAGREIETEGSTLSSPAMVFIFWLENDCFTFAENTHQHNFPFPFSLCISVGSGIFLNVWNLHHHLETQL